MSKNSQIENINTLSSKGIIFAWFLGLAIFSWFNSDVNLSLITNLILAIGGMFGSSILIGIPCSMIASAWNKYKTGKSNTKPDAFKAMANIAIILSFGASYLVVGFIS